MKIRYNSVFKFINCVYLILLRVGNGRGVCTARTIWCGKVQVKTKAGKRADVPHRPGA